MKKTILLLFSIAFISLTACENQDLPIQINQLPSKAQTFIKTHFPNLEVSYAKKENKTIDVSYEVVFVNGYQIDFNKNGNWKEVDCKHDAVPTAIVPTPIRNWVTANYNQQTIVEISWDDNRYNVHLKNGLELIFNKKGEFLRLDD